MKLHGCAVLFLAVWSSLVLSADVAVWRSLQPQLRTASHEDQEGWTCA